MLTLKRISSTSKHNPLPPDSDIEEADPDELIEKAKREKESEKISKEKAKKEEKDKTKKTKGKEAPAPAAAQAQPPKGKDAPKVVQNAQNNKPPRLSRPKNEEERTKSAPQHQAGDQTESPATRQHETPVDGSAPADRPFRGRGAGGFRGGRGRGGFPRDDAPIQGFSEGNVMGESREFRRGGFRGRGGRRGFGGPGVHPQERHSGSRVTGVKAMDKRNGAGANNWGTGQDELDLIDSEKLQTGIVEVHPEAANVPGDINADENVPPAAEGEEAAEDKPAEEQAAESNEPRDMTLEEYLAKSVGERERLQGVTNLQKKSKKKAPVIAEGKTTAFKGMVAYVKKSTPEDEESDEEYEEEEDSEENTKRKRTLEVPFRHNRSGNFGSARGSRGGSRGGPPRERGGGDFRGGRGRGGRGGPIGSSGREEKVQLQLTSDVDFPSL